MSLRNALHPRFLRTLGAMAALAFVALTVPAAGPASASTQAPTVPGCSSSALQIQVGPSQAAAGNVGTPIVIVNRGTARCSLWGFPTVTGLTAAPSPRPISFIRTPRSQIYRAVTPWLVLLNPGGSASFGISYVDALNQQFGDRPQCQMNGLVVTLPHVAPAHAFTVAFPKQPHDQLVSFINVCFAGFTLGLTPVVSGATPPGH